MPPHIGNTAPYGNAAARSKNGDAVNRLGILPQVPVTKMSDKNAACGYGSGLIFPDAAHFLKIIILFSPFVVSCLIGAGGAVPTDHQYGSFDYLTFLYMQPVQVWQVVPLQPLPRSKQLRHIVFRLL